MSASGVGLGYGAKGGIIKSVLDPSLVRFPISRVPILLSLCCVSRFADSWLKFPSSSMFSGKKRKPQDLRSRVSEVATRLLHMSPLGLPISRCGRDCVHDGWDAQRHPFVQFGA